MAVGIAVRAIFAAKETTMNIQVRAVFVRNLARALVAPSLLVFVGCGMPAEPPPVVPVELERQGLQSDTCSKSETDQGTTVKFSTAQDCRSGDQRCRNNALTLHGETLFGDLRMQTVEIRRQGNPLMNISTWTWGAQGTEARYDYHAPITGLKMAYGWTDGIQVGGSLDDRNVIEAPVGTPSNQFRFYDGGPAPTLVISSDLRSGIDALLKKARDRSSECVKKQMGGAASADLAALGGTPGHQTNTLSPLLCQGCRGVCHSGFVYCAYGAGLASAGCGPFAILCALGGIATCTGAELGCLSACHGSGRPCCPVACGGEGQPNFISPPRSGFVGCCASGESCLDRGAGTCCPAGSPPCGKTCCGPGNVCVGQGASATCCPQGNPVCGNQCCLPGEMCGTNFGAPSCFRPCRTNADCGTLLCNSQGRCVVG